MSVCAYVNACVWVNVRFTCESIVHKETLLWTAHLVERIEPSVSCANGSTLVIRSSFRILCMLYSTLHRIWIVIVHQALVLFITVSGFEEEKKQRKAAKKCPCNYVFRNKPTGVDCLSHIDNH